MRTWEGVGGGLREIRFTLRFQEMMREERRVRGGREVGGRFRLLIRWVDQGWGGEAEREEGGW